MKIRFAAVLYAAFALALVAFAGTALAGNGNGGNSANAPGQQKQDSSSQPASSSQAQSSSTSAPAPATTAPATHGNSANAPGRTKHSAASTGSTKHQSTAGVKPSNQTNSVKPTSAPASSDKTKLYGNGKTAGQIATSAGYPDAVLYGPGNSQPHKYNCGGHYVDVHALKAKGKKCAPSGTQAAQQTEQKTEEHTASVAPCTATKTLTETQSGGVEHFIGPKGSGRFVVIHPSTHSAHYRDKHPDVILPSSTVTHTVVVGSTACSTTTQSSSSASVSSVSTQTASASAAPAPAAAAPAPAAAAPTAAGGVLGAVTPLHSATPKASAGVLGATVGFSKKVGGTTLPFTGLQLWIFAAVALGLILAGAFARRASADRI